MYKFQQTLLRGVATLFDEQASKDVTVYIGDHSFPCHKAILIIWSDYFKAMFSSGMKEEIENTITLKDDHMTSPGAFGAVLQYMYKGVIHLKLKRENVLEILSCASYLSMETVEQICVEFIERLVKAKRVPDTSFLRAFFMAAENSKLERIAVEFAAKNFSTVAETEEFLDYMTTERVCKILDSDFLEDLPEGLIIKTVTRWLLHKQERLEDMTAVYQHLKLGELNSEELQHVMDQVCCDFMKSQSPDKEEFMKTLFHLAANSQSKMFSEEVQLRYPKMFTKRKRDQVLAAIEICSGEVVHWENPKGHPLKEFSLNATMFMDTPKSKVYRNVLAFEEESQELFQGLGNGDDYQRWKCLSRRPILFRKYDAKDGSWKELPRPIHDHHSPLVVALGTKLFVLESNENKCEIFDEKLNQWLEVKPNGNKFAVSCTSFKDLIWVLFRENYDGGLFVSYVYNPRENAWSSYGRGISYESTYNYLLTKVGNHLFNCQIQQKGFSKCRVFDVCCKWKEIPQPDIPDHCNGPPAIQVKNEIYIVLNGVAIKTDIDVNVYRPFPVSLDEWKGLDISKDVHSHLWVYKSRSHFVKKLSIEPLT